MAIKQTIRQILKPRPKRVHKKQLGQVLLVVGSQEIPGAGILSARAALRSGAGFVIMGYPQCLANIYRKAVPEAVHSILPQTKKGSLASQSFLKIFRVMKKMDVLAIGPGLARDKSTASLIVRLVKTIDKPIILDADALNILADKKAVGLLAKRKAITIVTPHEGEMSRLTKLSVKQIAKKRTKLAKEYARRWRSIIVLKGYQTVITSPAGKTVINKTGGPALATPGSGDVLTGIMATLLVQNLDKPFEASVVAVYLHGLAGDVAAKDLGERSVMASDIIDYLPGVTKKARP